MQARNLCKEWSRGYTRMQVVTAYLPFSGTTVKFLFLVSFGNTKLNQKMEKWVWGFGKYWWWWWCDDENMNIHFSTHLQKALVLSKLRWWWWSTCKFINNVTITTSLFLRKFCSMFYYISRQFIFYESD